MFRATLLAHWSTFFGRLKNKFDRTMDIFTHS